MFLFVFAYAMVMYLLAITLVPPADFDRSDYEEFFLGRSRLFFSLLIVRGIVDFGDTYWTGGEEFSHPAFFIVSLGILALYGVGASTENRKVHAGLAGLFTAASVILLFVDGGAPGQ